MPGEFATQIEDAIRTGVCSILAGGAETVGFFQGIVSNLTAPFPPPPVPNLPAIFHREFCGENPPPDGWNERPITINFSPTTGPVTVIAGNLTLVGPNIAIGGAIVGGAIITFLDPTLNIPITINADINLTTGDIIIGGPAGVDGVPGGGPPPPPGGDTRTTPEPPPGDVVGGPPGGGPPPDSENPEGDEPPDELPPEGAPGLGRKLIGVLAWVDDTGEQSTQVFDNDSPTLNVPDLGQVVFKVSVANQISYLSPIRIHYTRQWIPCPDEAGAVGASVINRPGVPVRLSYVYDQRGLRTT